MSEIDLLLRIERLKLSSFDKYLGVTWADIKSAITAAIKIGFQLVSFPIKELVLLLYRFLRKTSQIFKKAAEGIFEKLETERKFNEFQSLVKVLGLKEALKEIGLIEMGKAFILSQIALPAPFPGAQPMLMAAILGSRLEKILKKKGIKIPKEATKEQMIEILTEAFIEDSEKTDKEEEIISRISVLKSYLRV